MPTPTTQAADAIRAPFAELGIHTYEDIEELHAAEGWGCKSCGQLHAPSWWTCRHGDIYCLSCKRQMASELRIRFVAFPRRLASDRAVARTHNPASQGFEVAAFQRAEYARMHETSAEAECACGLTSCYGCRRRLIDDTAQKIHAREVKYCTGMGFDVEAHARKMADQYRTKAINELALEFAN